MPALKAVGNMVGRYIRVSEWALYSLVEPNEPVNLGVIGQMFAGLRKIDFTAENIGF